jgi:hypothetical protein
MATSEKKQLTLIKGADQKRGQMTTTNLALKSDSARLTFSAYTLWPRSVSA